MSDLERIIKQRSPKQQPDLAKRVKVIVAPSSGRTTVFEDVSTEEGEQPRRTEQPKFVLSYFVRDMDPSLPQYGAVLPSHSLRSLVRLPPSPYGAYGGTVLVAAPDDPSRSAGGDRDEPKGLRTLRHLLISTQRAFDSFSEDQKSLWRELNEVRAKVWKISDDLEESRKQNAGTLETIATRLDAVRNEVQRVAPVDWDGHPQHRNWRSYRSYARAELRAITPSSVTEHDRAIDLTFSDPDLKGVPLRTPDGMTLYVPADAVELFREKGVEFSVSVLPERWPSKRGDMYSKK